MPGDQSSDAGAVAIATVAATLAAHIEQCKSDKQEIKQTQSEIKMSLARQDADRNLMHRENQSRFRRLEVIYYFATAAVGILMFFGTDMGRRVLHVLFNAPPPPGVG